MKFYVKLVSILQLADSLVSTFAMCSSFVFSRCWRNLANAVIVKQL